MKRSTKMNTCFKLSVLASALALAIGPASAADVYLAAKPIIGGMDLPVSGGIPENVPMWGYVEDVGGVCFSAADEATREICVDGLPDPTLPGPRLTVAPGDPVLNIRLSNGLSQPTSIVIPGVGLPVSGGVGPTWNFGPPGARTDPAQRVRSYGSEAPPNGGAESYAFTLDRSGTFIYHSGTSPQLQVYMGLYGAVTKDAVAGEAYAGVPYDNEVILFYSDVDPVHNTAVNSGDPSYTPIHYNAKWFLVNGEPYEAGMADIPAGSAVTDAADTRPNTLLRLLSAASETHVPTLQGLYMSIHAEDGFQYGWEDTAAAASGFSPREQYSAMLPPLKTKDAIIVAHNEGRYAVYDGNGYMTNPSDTSDFGQGDELGGMLRFLDFSANEAPVAVNDMATTPEDTPVLIDLLANDSDPNTGDVLTVVSATDGMIGTVTVTDPSCCVTYTPHPDQNGLDQFDYIVADSTGATSTGTALVDVTVTAVNDPPVAVDESYTTDEDTALVVAAPGVLGNDSDVDGDTLTPVVQAGPANGTLVLNGDGSFTYTPTADYNGSDSFTYVANDGTVASNVATVSITVNAVNDAPVAVDDAYSVDQDTTLNVVAASGVLSNDTDVDGPTALTAAPDTGPGNGSVTLNADGSFDYTPNGGFFGSDSFTYTASDGVDSTPATVTVTVNEVATGPMIQLYFSTLQGGGNGSVPGVAGPFNNADIYAHDGAVYSRIVDAGFAGNVDALHVVDADHFYVSFANNGGVTNGGVTFQDEDIAEYNGGTWSMYFDGSASGLQSGGTAGANGYDIDAISIDGGVLYFSIVGNNNVGGLGSGDDADIYKLDGTTYTREFDASAVGLPGNADIDGLTVKDGTYYMSFLAGTTTVPTLGGISDEAVVSYTGGTWAVYFSGPGLTGAGRDVDAVHVP